MSMNSKVNCVVEDKKHAAKLGEKPFANNHPYTASVPFCSGCASSVFVCSIL